LERKSNETAISLPACGEANEVEFALTRGCTGFDGDVEAGIAGEGACPS
jgi:hypothetical protein